MDFINTQNRADILANTGVDHAVKKRILKVSESRGSLNRVDKKGDHVRTKNWFAGLLSGGLLFASGFGYAGELTIAESNRCNYQIVIPDKGKEAIVDKWLFAAAKLMQAAFETNGFRLDVVMESEKAADKPGIYLGATEFAKMNGIKVEQHDDWTYYQKAVNKDLIIAGNDKKDPFRTVRGTNTPLALLGTVKGVCDFLREYAGVRFLFGTGDRFNKDGSLKIDTRSIAFLPVKKIATPEHLDLKKTPMMLANYDFFPYESFHQIALNFFPPLSGVGGGGVRWQDAVPRAEYAKSHPEYFPLINGQRVCDLSLPHTETQYCVTSKGVQDLMYKALEKLITNGVNTIEIAPVDGIGLCCCNCEDCNKLFGMKGESDEQRSARARSGKLWQAYFKITERIRKNYPDVKIVVLNYQDTPISADIIKKFPANVIPKIQFASQLHFDKLKGVEFPAGICGFEETFTTFGQAGPYVPERTPEHMAEFVKTMARNNVRWSGRDGTMGYVPGMQGPAYYVYGRMMDDPTADWKTILAEFNNAAFGGKVISSQMGNYFEILHMQMALYSDFFGVFMPAWDRKYSRAPFYGSYCHDSKWHVMSMYTPEYCADANQILTAAEKAATDPDVKARLHLIRIEFDYIRKMSGIFYLQSAWTINPSQANLDQLLDAIDDWHADLEKLAEGTGGSEFKPLSDWSEMRPFFGNSYNHAALRFNGYNQQWAETCLNWDTKAIRAGILTDKHQIRVAMVEEAPGIDSKAWDTAPESVFKVHGGMPFINVRTTMRVLRDKDNAYIRVECLWPSEHPEDMSPTEPDGKNIFKQECVELGIMPPDAGGKVYRLAANPAGSRYDSIFTPDKSNRMTEDVKWDGKWEFAVKTSGKKSTYSLPYRVWTAWFRIPFSDFGGKAPAAGETWGFNAARNKLLWSGGANVTAREALGELIF